MTLACCRNNDQATFNGIPFRLPLWNLGLVTAWLCVHTYLVGALAHGALGHWLGGLLGLRSLASRGRRFGLSGLARHGGLGSALPLGRCHLRCANNADDAERSHCRNDHGG